MIPPRQVAGVGTQGSLDGAGSVGAGEGGIIVTSCPACPEHTSGWVWALIGAAGGWVATKVGTEYLSKRR